VEKLLCQANKRRKCFAMFDVDYGKKNDDSMADFDNNSCPVICPIPCDVLQYCNCTVYTPDEDEVLSNAG